MSDSTVSLVPLIGYTVSEGSRKWEMLPKPVQYYIDKNISLDRETIKEILKLDSVHSVLLEDGSIYDFLLNCWRHRTMKGTEKTEKKEEVSSIEEILAERGSRYGSFSGHSSITQGLKFMMKNSPKWPDLSDSQKEALEMVAHKIGRILNGDPNYLDSWVDIVGYTQLIVDQLNGKNT